MIEPLLSHEIDRPQNSSSSRVGELNAGKESREGPSSEKA